SNRTTDNGPAYEKLPTQGLLKDVLGVESGLRDESPQSCPPLSTRSVQFKTRQRTFFAPRFKLFKEWH
ncbi:MAG: hypothetical protein ACI8VR_001744, partial [Candidatus Azotimanducaceae bacterium]